MNDIQLILEIVSIWGLGGIIINFFTYRAIKEQVNILELRVHTLIDIQRDIDRRKAESWIVDKFFEENKDEDEMG